MSKLTDFLKKNGKQHVIDTTAMLTESNPAYCFFEVGISGMSDEHSIKSRFIVAGMAYGGLGFAYARGRDLWKRVFKITDQTSEKKQFVHDSLYNGLFSATVSVPIYLLSGVRDPKELAIATGCSIAFGAVNGVPQGITTDIYRDLTGIEKCERKIYPEYVRRQSLRTKKALAVGLATASISVMALMYFVTNDDPVQEQTVNYNTLEETLLEGDGK